MKKSSKMFILDISSGFLFRTEPLSRLRIGDGRFFLVLNFNQGMKVEFCTSVDTKPFSSPIASTILADVIFYLF